MAMIFAQEANWAAAVPAIFGSMSVMCAAICSVVALYLRLKSSQSKLEDRVTHCEAMCKACEDHRKADQEKFAKELAIRDELLNEEFPSWKSGGEEISAKLLESIKADSIKISVVNVARLVQAVKDRKRKAAESAS